MREPPQRKELALPDRCPLSGPLTSTTRDWSGSPSASPTRSRAS